MSVFSLNCQKRHSMANTYAAPKLDCKNKNGFYINQAHTKVKPIQFYVKICNFDRVFPKINFNELFSGDFILKELMNIICLFSPSCFLTFYNSFLY